ncbi:MAG: hypothetical protein Q8K75_06040 [Chlamydiales bacterium]|nr:hypothetical protein [Chlamydiales bacterium]
MFISASSTSGAEINTSLVSEFNSSIDELLVSQLGLDLYQNNVTKLICNGQRYILIGDLHRDQKFRNLFRGLVSEAKDREGDFALFLEGIARDPVAEAGWIGVNSQALIFGLEDQNLLDLATYISRFYFLLALEDVDSSDWPAILRDHQLSLCQEIWNLLEVRECLDHLKNNDPMLTPLIATLEQITSQAKNHKELGELLQEAPQFSNSLWAVLYREMALYLMPKIDLSDQHISSIQVTLNYPHDNSAFLNFSNEVVLHARNRVMLSNIVQTMKSWPNVTEIVIFVGDSHISEIVEGLQTLHPMKDEL